MSLENLVTMRPIGLESKNRILALISASDIAVCSLVFPANNILNRLIALTNTKSMKKNIEAAKSAGYLPFYCSISDLFDQ